MMTFDRLFAKQNASTYIYIYIYMNGICVITLVTILWLNQEPHTKWSICFRSQSPLGFKYVESICSDSGHCFWVKMNINIYIYTHVLIWYYITISLFTLHDCIHNHTHTLLRYVFLYMHILNYFPPYQLLLSPPSEVKLFNSSGSSRTRSTQVGQLSHWTMGMGGKGEVCGSAHSLFGDTIFRCCFGVELIQNIRQLFDTECGLKHCSI